MNIVKRIHGRNLHVVLAGAGDPILLVHGFPLDHSMWKEQVQVLSAEFMVIAPDLRGFGKSEGSADETIEMADFADDLANLVSVLDLKKPVTFCGLSMGGYIAWQFFQRHRELLDRLILCDTKASADSAEAKQGRYETADRVLNEGPEFLANSMVEKLFSSTTRDSQPEIVVATQEVIRATSPATIAAALRGMARRPDLTDMLPLIDIPTLVIVGEEDAITTSTEMKSMAEKIPNAQFVEIRSAGHMAPLERADDVNSALLRFLK